jgi:TPR repeat protein
MDSAPATSTASPAQTGTLVGTPSLPSNGKPSFTDALVKRALNILAEVEDGSLEDAYNLLDKAADLGDRRGQWMAGRMTIAGVGTGSNRTKGLARILAAAEAGEPEALTYMGLQYLQDGNATTDETGMAYLQRAADQGHAAAISALVFFREEAN